MTHPDKDTLLKFVLETLDNPETDALRQHLSLCEQCKGEERRLGEEVSRLSSIEIPVEMASPPRLRRRSRFLVPSLKVAAVLAVGFLFGYATAQLSNPVHPIPVQQRLIPAQVAIPSSGYVPAQQVDLRTPAPT